MLAAVGTLYEVFRLLTTECVVQLSFNDRVLGVAPPQLHEAGQGQGGTATKRDCNSLVNLYQGRNAFWPTCDMATVSFGS